MIQVSWCDWLWMDCSLNCLMVALSILIVFLSYLLFRFDLEITRIRSLNARKYAHCSRHSYLDLEFKYIHSIQNFSKFIENEIRIQNSEIEFRHLWIGRLETQLLKAWFTFFLSKLIANRVFIPNPFNHSSYWKKVLISSIAFDSLIRCDHISYCIVSLRSGSSPNRRIYLEFLTSLGYMRMIL